MNDENSNHQNPAIQPLNSQPISNSENNFSSAPISSHPSAERVIQPSDSIKQEFEAQKQQTGLPHKIIPNTLSGINDNAIYPEATKTVSNSSLNPSQQFALASTQSRSEESDRPVSLRVKSLLVVAILTMLSAVYGFATSLTVSESSSFAVVIAVISLVQFGMSAYLLVGKDHNTAALILKIYLVFQSISLLLSFANPYALMISGASVLFLFYVYTRVKSLSYY